MPHAGEACHCEAYNDEEASCRSGPVISSLGLKGDREVRRTLRHALRDAWPAMREFGWRLRQLCELDPADEHVGYNHEGTIFLKVRDPHSRPELYPYSFVLATLLHELTHLSYEGHGKAFYRRLVLASVACGADASIRREVHIHVCSELLNAVCENDARRARALLAVLPEAASCRPLNGGQFPLEYAAHHGRVSLTKLLLQARADPNVYGQKVGMPPLARAAAQGNVKTVRLLLQAGARGAAWLPPELQRVQRSKSSDYLEKEVCRTFSLPDLGKGGHTRRLALGGAGSLAL